MRPVQHAVRQSDPHACVGAVTVAALRAAGAAGVVVNGLVTDLDDLTVAVDEAHPSQTGREAAEIDSRSVRTRRDRARDRLFIDVALIRQCEPEVPQIIADLADGSAASHPSTLRLRIHSRDAAESGEVDKDSTSLNERCERMARPDDANLQALADRESDDVNNFVVGGRAHSERRCCCLISSPV